MMIRVLLVEDQAIIREGLKVILEQDERIKVTHQAENGQLCSIPKAGFL